MKKIFLNIFAAAFIIAASAFPTAAEEIIDQDSLNKNGSTNVSYNEEVSYTVVIPADVTFTDADAENGYSVERGLYAQDVRLDYGSELKVSVESLNGFKMTNNSGYIDYTLSANTTVLPVGSPQDILIVDAGKTSGWTQLTFTAQSDRSNAVYAGTYSDTLTFTAYIE